MLVSLFFSSASSLFQKYVSCIHVAYFDLYLLQDHLPKQAHLVSEQPDLHVSVAEPEEEVHNIVPLSYRVADAYL
jgi:hypothetical protein